MKTLGDSDSFNMSSYFHSKYISKYENYLSVKKVSETVTITSSFYFSGVDKADIEKSFGNLNFSKVGTLKSIPTKCLKVTSDVRSPYLPAIWNQELILNKIFPQELKLAYLQLCIRRST